MNNIKRGKLEKANKFLASALDYVKPILDDEQQAFNNTPAKFQDSWKGEKMQVCIGQLFDAIENINDAMESIREASK